MVEENTPFTPSAPDFSGNGVAVWKAIDKNDKPYLKVVVLGGKPINCFAVEPKANPSS